MRPHCVRHSPRGRRELGSGVGIGTGDFGLGELVKGSKGVVLVTKALVLEGLHGSYARRHNPRPRSHSRS
ncbi:hypothetical protein CRG98_032833 [Punica granatum]|uniref:Uncharacterized protein n=1 Tax=Punica granatum TaxID=22663 RepID=A0A2I0IRZ6_PUNGR|nr:hypothetical protein CRG98_032833 [Punica granatum]